MTNPNESPQARLDAMVSAWGERHDLDPDACTAPWEAVALDLITQLDAANARAEAAEAKLSEATAVIVTLRQALAAQVPDRITNHLGPCGCSQCLRREALSTTSHANSAAVERIRAEILKELGQ